MKRFLPYLVPVISVFLIIGLFLFLDDSNITGFTIANPGTYVINSEVKLEILEDQTIPGDALIVVNIDDREASMQISEFIVKAGGEEKENYEGESLYVLQLSDFDIDNEVSKGNYVLGTRLEYQGGLISESSTEITAG